MSGAGLEGRRGRRRNRAEAGRTAGVLLHRAVWVAVAASGVVGLVGSVILLRGDPSYLVQFQNRGGVPVGDPAPVSFPWRAVLSVVLVGGLAVAGRRAVSDAAGDLRLPVVI